MGPQAHELTGSRAHGLSRELPGPGLRSAVDAEQAASVRVPHHQRYHPFCKP